jgi:hypothetical protein
MKRLSKESRQGLDEFMNEATTSKPCKASGILHRARREDFDLRIHAQQKSRLLHIWLESLNL